MLPDQTIQNVITFTLQALRYYRAMGVKITGIMTDNGSAYRSPIAAPSESPAFENMCLYPPHQRQGRALYPDSAAGMGLCLLLPQFRCPYPRIAILDRTLQFLPSSFSYR
jgi:hypothetical protein